MKGKTMRPIDSDKFLQDMADLYRQAGWDEREVHFSLADLRSNIGMEDVIPIPRREADTVPVIRCKDCEFYNPEKMCVAFSWIRGSKIKIRKDEEDFCSWAMKKKK